MSGKFDPYHRWLGISPKHQPANRYRLLGLELFEDDPEVIHDAAERQMAHVRTYQLGPDVELSQQILNELASAKACLMEPERKAAYDASLRAAGQRSPAVAAPPPAPRGRTAAIPPPAAPHVAEPPEVLEWLTDVDQPRPMGRSSAVRSKTLLLMGGAVVALLVAIGFVMFLNGGWKPPDSPPQSTQVPRVPVDRYREDEVPPRPPKLADIPDQAVEVGEKVELSANRFSDLGTWGERIRYSLAADAPRGATIDARTGWFEWAPSQEQPPGAYHITVEVRHADSGSLGDQTKFAVTVQKPTVTVPPVVSLTIDPINPPTFVAGSPGKVTIGVQKSDGFVGGVTFSLTPPRSWVAIDPVNGTVTCAPKEAQAGGRYSTVVSVVCNAMKSVRDEKQFDIIVEAPKPPPIDQKEVRESEFKVEVGPASIKLSGSDGKVQASANFDTHDKARASADMLWGKCQSIPLHAVGFCREGTTEITAITSVAFNKLEGPAVFFDPGPMFPQMQRNSEPFPRNLPNGGHLNMHVTYKKGKWDGWLTSWNTRDERELCCQYVNDKRHGLCCLFHTDALAAILECTRDKVDAVRIVERNRITTTVTNLDEASLDPAVGAVLREVDTIEKRSRTQDRYVRDQVQHAIHLWMAYIAQLRKLGR